MKNIVNELEKKNLESITNEKKWTRNCPQCNKELFYTRKDHRDTLNRKESLCFTCGGLKRTKLYSKEQLTKKCIKCQSDILFKNIDYLRNSKNKLCKSCSHIKYEINIPLIRMCPVCKNEIYYSNKYRYKESVEFNKTCKLCRRNKNRPKNLDLKRLCPKCGDDIFYANKQSYNVSLKNNSMCIHCHTRSPGRIQSEQEKEKRNIKFRGKKRTLESKQRYSDSKRGIKNPFYGIHVSKSAEHRRKIRVGVINNLNRKLLLFGKTISPKVNPLACQVIGEYGKENGYEFQHGLNGGEFYIKELGYWVDGYDKDKNVVIEYYERTHDRTKVKERDMKRQIEIIDFLKCRFIIIHESGGVCVY